MCWHCRYGLVPKSCSQNDSENITMTSHFHVCRCKVQMVCWYRICDTIFTLIAFHCYVWPVRFPQSTSHSHMPHWKYSAYLHLADQSIGPGFNSMSPANINIKHNLKGLLSLGMSFLCSWCMLRRYAWLAHKHSTGFRDTMTEMVIPRWVGLLR